MSSTTTKHLNTYKKFYINNKKHTLGLIFPCSAIRNESFTTSSFLALWDLIGVRMSFWSFALMSYRTPTMRHWSRIGTSPKVSQDSSVPVPRCFDTEVSGTEVSVKRIVWVRNVERVERQNTRKRRKNYAM